MAFPVVESTATSVQTSSSTSHPVTMPAGVAASDLLIVVVCLGSTTGMPAATGWTRKNHDVNANTSGLRLAVYTRDADGTEGATETVFTSNLAAESAHASYRISGSSGAANVEISAKAENASQDDSPNPPSLTPAAGSDDYLWIAAAGSELRAFASGPSGYSSFLNEESGTSLTDGHVGAAVRQLTASSEDPGVFTLDTSADWWVAVTLAVAPTAATAPNDPTDVVASNPTSTTVDLDWTDTNSASKFPRMYRRTPAGSGDFTFVEQLADASATSYTFTGLSPDTEYDFGVSYID